MAASTGPRALSPAGDVRSLALDTTSPAGARILYAGVTGVGVVQSTDGGRNWHAILNAATPAVAAALTGGGFGKVVVALAPPASPAKSRRHPGALRHDGRNRERAAYRRPLPEHGSGQYLERSSSHGIGGNNRLAPGRLQLPHGRRSRNRPATGRATSSISATNSKRGPLTRAAASEPWADSTPTRMHGRFLLSRVPSLSPIAAMTEDSSTAPAARHSRLSTLAGFRRRCSTTSTSSGTRRRA